MSRDIIQQGDWGYGDTKGLAKAVDVGYRKWLKKNGLEPEGYGGKSQAVLKGKKSFSYGNKTKS
jgi:hypothetical protein